MKDKPFNHYHEFIINVRQFRNCIKSLCFEHLDFGTGLIIKDYSTFKFRRKWTESER